MGKTYLDVPFAEKDEAKRVGARWDPAARRWYVPEGRALEHFSRWLPARFSPNIRSQRFWLMETVVSCWKCGAGTVVYGICLPESAETYEVDEERGEEGWQFGGFSTIPSYIDVVSPAVQAVLGQRAPGLRPDFSRTTQSTYYMNHCRHCGMKQGDHELHNEPGGGFVPMSEDDVAAIKLTPIPQTPFEASCGSFSVGVEWLEYALGKTNAYSPSGIIMSTTFSR